MSASIQDRLRAHFADRVAHEPLPGPSTDEALAELKAGSEVQVRYTRNGGRFPLRPLALAAAFLAICAAAGVVVARIEDPRRVTSGPDDDRPSVDTTVPRTTTPTTAPTTTAPPASAATGPTIVVSRLGALGWWDGTRWVPADDGSGTTAPDGGVPAAGGEAYQVVRLDDPIVRTVGGWQEGCWSRTVDAGIPDDGEGPHGIAVTGVADPRPRPVTVLRDAGAYKAAAVEVGAGLGITDDDPDIAQAISGDLDGDGTDEVLIVAERVSNTSLLAEAGDYSVLFIRRLVGGSVQTTVVEHHIAEVVENQTPYLAIFRVSALADLNGDRRMEVAVESQYYEGVADTVYEYGADGSLTEVLSTGCGA